MKKITSKMELVVYAIQECIKEMYNNAWPKTTYKKALKEFDESSVEDQNKYPFYERYYLSHDKFVNIVNDYIERFGIEDSFKYAMDNIIKDLKEGKSAVSQKYLDKYDIPKESIYNMMDEKSANICLDLLEKYKNYYNNNHYENVFRMNVSNFSPCSYKETAEKYWDYKKSLTNK